LQFRFDKEIHEEFVQYVKKGETIPVKDPNHLLIRLIGAIRNQKNVILICVHPANIGMMKDIMESPYGVEAPCSV
jgi:hypothetical protein